MDDQGQKFKFDLGSDDVRNFLSSRAEKENIHFVETKIPVDFNGSCFSQYESINLAVVKIPYEMTNKTQRVNIETREEILQKEIQRLRNEVASVGTNNNNNGTPSS